MNKFKVLSADDMYNFFLEDKLKSNNSYFIKNKKLYYSSDREIEVVSKQIELSKDQYYKLIELDNKTSQQISDISDLEVSLSSLKKRKKELTEDIRKVKLVIDFITFKKILTLYNTKAGDRIIEGERLNLLNGLGFLLARRIERTFSTKKVNWGETNKQRDSLTGELPVDPVTNKKKLIYHLDEEYCRIHWERAHGVKNLSVYRFEPTGGQPGKGYRQKFSKANLDNKLLRLRYKYHSVSNH